MTGCLRKLLPWKMDDWGLREPLPQEIAKAFKGESAVREGTEKG